ncbi:MAG: hypothetical protein OES24_04135 [Acidimicrobiia bacterium]|nr:hypothetical protein [Acidimicrobiia bacterium]
MEALVVDMRTSVHGELSGRNQIVDHLLDLRLACRDNVATLAVIDRLLGELPGRTTVANAWWLEALVEIERTHRSGMAAAAQTNATAPASQQPGTGAAPLPRRRPQL